MRGSDGMQEALFTLAKLEDFVPPDPPLRTIRDLVNEALVHLNGLFNTIYCGSGQTSLPPEKLLHALLVQDLFFVRCERQLMEQVRYNMLYRWFIGLAIDDEVWDHSSFSMNRDRLLEHAVVESCFTEVMTLADKRGLLSREHFSVDGTLIQAWASHKSFVRKDGGNDDANRGGPSGRNTQADWKGKPRSSDTHASIIDPDARLFRKSHHSAAILSYRGHVLMENRSGLVVAAVVTHADGLGERAAALAMLDTVPGAHPKTLAADKAYDTRDFIEARRQRRVTPHVASNNTRVGGSAIDGRTIRHTGYALSQTIRKRVEEHFGWGKTMRAHQADVVPRHQTGRSALQADHDREQHRANGSNAERGAQRSDAVRRETRWLGGQHSASKGRDLDGERLDREQDYANHLVPRSSVNSVRRNSTACEWITLSV